MRWKNVLPIIAHLCTGCVWGYLIVINVSYQQGQHLGRGEEEWVDQGADNQLLIPSTF
jgi:hypothetical protein